MAIHSFATFQPQFDHLQEAKKFTASQWEQLIVIAFNGGWSRDRDTFGITEADYKNVAEIASKIATDIKRATGARRTEMLHFGTGGGETVRTVDWWKGKNTPKTDCYTTNGVRVSLKKEGGSQLMSGLRDETISTFRAATKYLNTTEDAYTPLLSQIESILSKRVKAGQYNINTIATVAKNRKDYKSLSPEAKADLAIMGVTSDADLKQWIPSMITFKKGETATVTPSDKESIFALAKEIINMREEFRKLTPVVQTWFEKNPQFKLWFTYEAASGHLKFSPTPKASANWIVEFDPDGGPNEVNRLEESSSTSTQVVPSAYTRALSQKTTFRLSFKTSSGSAKGGAAVAAVRSANKTQKQQRAQQESVSGTPLEYFAESAWRDIMESVLLTEGAWDTMKSATASLGRALSQWIGRIIAKLRELLSSGIEAFFTFLGITVDTVDVDGIDMLFSE